MNDARKRRAELAAELDAIDSASACVDFQANLLGARMALGRNSSRSDIEKLLLIGDALAWRYLHPHAIRQLAKNTQRRDRFNLQSSDVERVLQLARQISGVGAVPLLSDLTNILRIGDLVVVGDPERPSIVECKSGLPHPSTWRRGRLGRQISRAIGTDRYLSGLSTKVHGELSIRTVIETPYRPIRDFSFVSKCLSRAMHEPVSVLFISESECLFACPIAKSSEALETINREVPNGWPGATTFGSSLGLMNGFDGLFAPPLSWPIPLDQRLAVFEGELVLGHLLDVSSLAGYVDAVNISVDDQDDDGRPVVATKDGNEYKFSWRLVQEIIYGYETLESFRRGVAAFANQLSSIDLDSVDTAPDGLSDASALVARLPKTQDGTIAMIQISDSDWSAYHEHSS